MKGGCLMGSNPQQPDPQSVLQVEHNNWYIFPGQVTIGLRDSLGDLRSGGSTHRPGMLERSES